VRIAVLAPISWRVPPRHYGPWELFASLLTEGLVSRGHDVTLFAAGDSVTAARLESVVPQSWSEDPTVNPKVAECLHIAAAFEDSSSYDVIHNSFDFLPLTYSRLVSTPVVTTIHGFSSPEIVRVYAEYDSTNHYVAISDSDRHASLNYAATIHHGIDLKSFEFAPTGGDHLAYFGRIHPDKGTHRAIACAKRAGLPLHIAGVIHDERYFETEVAPHIDGDSVKFLGPVMAEDRAAFLGSAAALLHLISFDEPFGFSVVESMACGTPVIAFRRGSMPELIDDGRTGAVVDDVDDAVAAIPAVRALDRRIVSATATAFFGVDRMVDAYVNVYDEAVSSTARAGSRGG
jgi:glycosyltransferase involved in cell wall biosynthesis